VYVCLRVCECFCVCNFVLFVFAMSRVCVCVHSARKGRPRSDLYCVGRDVTHSLYTEIVYLSADRQSPILVVTIS